MATISILKTAGTGVALALLLGTLPGCDSDDGPRSTSLAITPSLGLVRNATVVVKSADGRVVQTGTTGSDGKLTVKVPGVGPYIVEVQGDADADYFDEYTNTYLPFAPGRSIRAMIPSGSTNVGVTGLTDIAYGLLSGSGAEITNGNIDKANSAVLQTFASGAPAGLTSILTPPQVLSAQPSARYLTNNAAGMYAAILAGLANTGQSAATPALTAIEQLRRDASDGALDGNENGTPIAGRVYSATNFTTDFATTVSSVMNTWATTALQSAVSTYTITALAEPTWDVTGGGGGGNTPATVHSELAGQYSLVFHRAEGVSAAESHLVDGQTYDVVISSSGALQITGRTYRNPFYRSYGGTPHQAEVIWLADGIDIEYALSNNETGAFNEINVGDAGQANAQGIPKFLGQLREPAAGPDYSALTALAGNHTMVVTGTGGALVGISPAFSIGNDMTFGIAANGAIDSARINRTFTPGDAGTSFAHYPNVLEPRVELSRVTGDNGTPADTSDDPSERFIIYLQGGVAVAGRYEQTTSCGGGCSSTKYVVFENRPIAAAHQQFIDDLLATGIDGQTFTVIQRGNFSTLPTVCSTLFIDTSVGATAGSSPLTLSIGGLFSERWVASYANLGGNAALRTMKLWLFNIVLDDLGSVRIEERSGNTVTAVATRDTAAIAAAGCSTAQ